MPLTPPPVADDTASQVRDIPRTTGEKVMGVASGILGPLGHGSVTDEGSNTNKLDDAISKHHQQRLDEARMHRQNYQTYASALATGTDPQTGEPLSPEKQQQYQTWKDASWAAYTKLAGVTKETKAALQKQGAIVDAIIQHGQQSRQGQVWVASLLEVAVMPLPQDLPRPPRHPEPLPRGHRALMKPQLTPSE
jgi:hypothetical protein